MAFLVTAVVLASFGTLPVPVSADSGTGTTVPTNAITPASQSSARQNIYTEWSFTIAESAVLTFSRPVWTIVSGTLPPGLELVNSPTSLRTVIVRGVPVVAGSYPIRFRIQRSFDASTDLEKDYTLAVLPMELEARTFPNARADVAYSQSVNVLGGVSPYSFTVVSGQLPSGLSIDSNGRISGIPNYALPYTFTLVAQDADNRQVSRQYSITVDPDSALTIATTAISDGRVGTAFSANLSATGGTAAYTWSISTGSLPPGVTLSGSQLVGTPTTAGTYSYTIKVTDAAGRTASRAFSNVIAAAGGTPTPTATLRILSSTLPNATVGTWYGYTFGGTGGAMPYTWFLQSGSVPPGLTVEGGSIYGTPTLAGWYSFTVKLNDAHGTSATQSFTLQVAAAGTTPTSPPIETPSAAAEREARVRNFDRMGVAIHALVKLPNDGNPLTQEDTAVYYLGVDGRRHAFPNSKVYATWYSDFAGVRVISGTDMASIPLGASVTYKPGVRLIKFATDPRVYAVSNNRVLRYVGTESLAASLYGSTWNRQIDDVPDTYYSDYSFGTAVSSGADYNPAMMRLSVTYVSDVMGL